MTEKKNKQEKEMEETIKGIILLLCYEGELPRDEIFSYKEKKLDNGQVMKNIYVNMCVYK
jgi:hypothetical protein